MLKETIKLASVRDSSRQSDNKAALRRFRGQQLKAVISGLPGVMAGNNRGVDTINV